MKKIILAFVICLCGMVTAFGQTACTVTGVVVDHTGTPLPYASVIVSQNQKELAGALTDSAGRYSLKIPQSDSSYQLTFSYMGGDDQSMDFVASSRKMTMDTLALGHAVEVLSDFVVTAEKENSQISVDRISITFSNQSTGVKGSVLDVLREEPTVSVDNDGNVAIRGNSNIMVMVNGIPTAMTSLASMPAADVKQVEIINNPNAKYDAEGTGGIINIVMKDIHLKGLSGSVSANYGFNHFVNGSISLNYSQKRYTFRFGYNTKYEDDIVTGTLDRKLNASGLELQQEFRTLRKVFNNNISLGGTFRINQRNKLDIDLRLRLPRLNTQQKFHNLYEVDLTEREENRSSNVTWNRENVDGTISYQYFFDNSLKTWMKLTGAVSKIWGHRPSFYFLEGDSIGKSNSGGSPLITFGQGDFTVVKPYGKWSSGFKFTYRQNNIFHEFYNLQENGWEYSNDFSNDLTHREFIPAGYMLFESNRAKPFSWEAGLRVEYSCVKLHSEKSVVDNMTHNVFIAPSASLEYKIKSEKSDVNQTISAAWSNRISRPTYPQLNPYMSMIDANTFEQGNMYLKPETSSQLEFSYKLHADIVMFYAGAYGKYRRNNITQVADLRDDLLLLTYVNGKYEMTTGIDLLLQVYAARWFEFTVSNSTWFMDTKGASADMDIDNRGVTNGSYLRLDFKPVRGMDIRLQYNVTTPEHFPQFTTELSHYMNIGITQKFLKNNLKVSLLLTDVFNTNHWDIHSANRIYQLTHHSFNKSRMLWLGISYSFNPPAMKKASPPETEERARLRLGL